MTQPGDIVTVWFPFSRVEAEPYKKRPVVVLAVEGSGIDAAILVMMVTSNARRVASPGRLNVPMPSNAATGLLLPSVARLTRVWTAESRDIASTLGAAPNGLLTEIKSRFATAFGFGPR